MTARRPSGAHSTARSVRLNSRRPASLRGRDRLFAGRAIKRAFIAAIERGDTGYAHPAGLADVARAVVLVPDVTVGLAEVLRLTIRPGSVIINTPAYPPFASAIAEYGRRVVDVPLPQTADGWGLDFDGLERAFRAGAWAYLLCNPHNPTGRAFGRIRPSLSPTRTTRRSRCRGRPTRPSLPG